MLQNISFCFLSTYFATTDWEFSHVFSMTPSTPACYIPLHNINYSIHPLYTIYTLYFFYKSMLLNYMKDISLFLILNLIHESVIMFFIILCCGLKKERTKLLFWIMQSSSSARVSLLILPSVMERRSFIA